MKVIDLIRNEKGHGQVPYTKELIKILLILITFPISFPVIFIIEWIKKRKK